MKKYLKYHFLLFFIIVPFLLLAQYPPAAGNSGTTAIAGDSSLFVNWAVDCSISRGYIDISQPEQGNVTEGEPLLATGKVDSLIVSLGDAGVATLTFEFPIKNGKGWDFAVFENGFEAFNGFFLELAFVEVSSDGEHFFRFPNNSKTDTSAPVGSFGLLDPIKLHNLAGKYTLGYGVPFDLEDLQVPEDSLDVNRITHVRIIDVVGSLEDAFATFDSDGNKINAPWPTPFPSGGFDLDAVGVFHEDRNAVSTSERSIQTVNIYPNPLKSGHDLFIDCNDYKNCPEEVTVIDMHGRVLFSSYCKEGISFQRIKLEEKGLYIVKHSKGQSISSHLICVMP